MDKRTAISAIRRESLDIPTEKFTAPLKRFKVGSYSERNLSDLPVYLLEDMLEMVRQLVNAEKETKRGSGNS